MAVNIAGDLLTSGNVVNPILNAVLLDTGSLTSGFPNHGYYEITVSLNCTVAGTFEVGVFNSDDTVSQTFRYAVSGGSGQTFRLHKVPIVDSQKFKIRSGLAIIGTANVALNLSCEAGD